MGVTLSDMIEYVFEKNRPTKTIPRVVEFTGGAPSGVNSFTTTFSVNSAPAMSSADVAEMVARKIKESGRGGYLNGR